jgi:mRNA-degrading endonuclease RelE of RelBE toxin-antitoxin system
MKIHLTHTFEKAVKKLHRNQIKLVEDAIEEIAKNPEIGEQKKGDLAGVRVYKFKIHKQQILLAYWYEALEEEISLLSFGVHENFYKKLKR